MFVCALCGRYAYICGVYVCSVCVPAGNTASALLLVGAGDMASQAVGSGMLCFPLIGP